MANDELLPHGNSVTHEAVTREYQFSWRQDLEKVSHRDNDKVNTSSLRCNSHVQHGAEQHVQNCSTLCRATNSAVNGSIRGSKRVSGFTGAINCSTLCRGTNCRKHHIRN